MRSGRLASTSTHAYSAILRSGLGLACLLLVAMSVAVAALFPWIAQLTPNAGPQPTIGYGAPSREHPLGTNPYGEDIFFTLLRSFYGSIFTALAAAAISVTLAIATGLLTMRVRAAGRPFKGFLSFFALLPSTPLMIFLVTSTQISPYVSAIVIALLIWPTLAGLVSSTLSLALEIRAGVIRTSEPPRAHLRVTARRAMASTFITAFALASAGALLADAGLGFLGMTDPRVDSWGRMLNEAFREDALIAGAWWAIVPAGMVVTLLSLSLTTIGYVLERDLWGQG